MKSITILIAIFTLTLTFSFKAFSQSMFCANPMNTICGGEAALNMRDNKDRYIESLKQEITKEARANTQRIINEYIKVGYEEERHERKKEYSRIMEVTPDNDNEVNKSEQISLRFQQTLLDETMNSARKRMSKIETVVTSSPIISYLKIFFKIAIEESTLNVATKQHMKRIVDSIIIGNFNDYINKSRSNSAYSLAIAWGCGADGMQKKGFATYLDDKRYVLICPGWLITMYNTPNMQQRINNMLWALAHEMAHHIDLKTYELTKKTYSPFIKCVFNNYRNNLNSRCKSDPSNECDNKMVKSHGNEMIADLWANKVIAIYARGNEYSASQMDNLLISSHGNLCGQPTTNITHPTDHFRIGTMLRLTPEIYNYLGCDNSNTMKKRTCTLAGEVSL